jgi:hypothetical protein
MEIPSEIHNLRTRLASNKKRKRAEAEREL